MSVPRVLRLVLGVAVPCAIAVSLGCASLYRREQPNESRVALEQPNKSRIWASKPPEIEYDAYTKTTAISSDVYLQLMSQDHDGIEAVGILFTTSEGRPEDVQEPTSVFMRVFSKSKEWAFLRCHSMGLMVDDSPIMIESEHRGEVSRWGHVTEFISGHITFSDLHSMEKASEVRVRVCNTEWKMDTQSIRQFAAVFHPKEPQDTSADVSKDADHEKKGALPRQVYQKD